jgi:hypothetical protein
VMAVWGHLCCVGYRRTGRRSECSRDQWRQLVVTKGTKAYIDAVVATGAATIASAVLNWRSDSLLHYSVFLFFFLAAATLKYRVPGVTGTYSPVFFFALLGSATLSFSEVAVASALAGIVQSTFRTKHRPSVIQVCFNAANLALSACAGLPIIQRQIPGWPSSRS